jgi:steroid 5-alpha reductase family enzyme
MLFHHLLISTVALWIYMTAFYFVARIRNNNSLADVAWGLGFVLLAVLNLAIAHEITLRQAVMTVLVTGWGLRLSFHVFSRNRGKPEDFRYAEMRRKWGKRAPLFSYTHVFLLQGVLLFIVAIPLILINTDPSAPFGITEALGVLVWCAGFAVEAAADSQLSRFVRFRKSPENPIMTKGLWRFSRHPNYFGEALLWWGIFLLAVRVPGGWAAAVSPLLIGFLLRFVSGVPLLEKKYRDNPRFREYARMTNAFVPWFQRKNRSPN